MQGKDRSLGMDCPITRRDFLDGSARLVGAAMVTAVAGNGMASAAALPAGTNAGAEVGGIAPPLRQGMRGFDDAAMNAGHAVRDGLVDAATLDTGEAYDLVVVGAGMAGLSAAYFYREQLPDARILILDGCDDFGGHARRVEFDVDGHQLLVCGGTEELWNPNAFPPDALRMLAAIGIDRERYRRHGRLDRDPFEERGLAPATFYAGEVFGEDRLVTDRPALQGISAERLRAWYDRTPMSAPLKAGLVKLHTDTTDYMAGLPVEEKIARLRKMSYADYLADIARIGPEAVVYVLRGGSGDNDNTSAGADTYSAWYAWRRNRRGFAGLGLPSTAHVSSVTADPGENIAFPDGNAGVARLLIRSMIPEALPGTSAEDSIRAPMRYDRLDRVGNPVRIRLSSMVARVAHLGDPASAREVEVTYVRDGRSERVRAAGVVMAGFNAMLPHLVPDLPQAQQEALRMAVRKPLVRSFVALRNWTAFERLGVSWVDCPGMFFSNVMPWTRPEWGGGYRNARTPDEPVIVYMNLANAVLEQHGSALAPRERWRAGRAALQEIDFATMERNIRDQLNRVLGAGGFDARRDIAGITVCRWSHGYAGGTNELYDPDWNGRTDAPWVIGRQRFGRIAISGSDAAATSLTSAAFAQSHRAAMELVNDVVRPVNDFRWSESDVSVQPGDFPDGA